MNALILAAGLGTRLRALNEHLPKALFPIADIPVLERIILRLKEAGFQHIIINIHYLGEQIIEFIRAQNNFGVHIYISDERAQLLDTGGGILKASSLLLDQAPLLVHNVDIMTDVDLRSLYQQHIDSKADATLFSNLRQTSRYLLVNNQQRLCGWTNLTTGEVLPASLTRTEISLHQEAFGGIQVISQSLFNYMNKEHSNKSFPIIPFYIANCDKALIYTLPMKSEHWFDIGKVNTLHEAEQYYREKGL